jgi:hypothetical protein
VAFALPCVALGHRLQQPTQQKCILLSGKCAPAWARGPAGAAWWRCRQPRRPRGRGWQSLASRAPSVRSSCRCAAPHAACPIRAADRADARVSDRLPHTPRHAAYGARAGCPAGRALPAGAAAAAARMRARGGQARSSLPTWRLPFAPSSPSSGAPRAQLPLQQHQAPRQRQVPLRFSAGAARGRAARCLRRRRARSRAAAGPPTRRQPPRAAARGAPNHVLQSAGGAVGRCSL